MSEYIPRLREELVSAAGRELAGQRRHLPVRPRRVALVLATAAAIAVAVVLAVSTIEPANDEQPADALPAGTALAYRVTPLSGGDAAAAAERSAAVLRARIAAAGIDGATVAVAGDQVGVDVGGAEVGAVAALAVPGELGIYDWEASVLGPDGRPAPGDEDVTGGQGAGQQATVSQYEAVARAAKADGGPGPASFWLVDDAAREVLAGPQPTRDGLTVTGGGRVVEVPGGVRVVRAPGPAPGRWYAIGGGAALGNADIARALAVRDPVVDEPAVALDLTARGQTTFESLTREVAHRGQAASLPGEDPMRANQHIAIVLDDQLFAVPFIDFRHAPDGIDGASGAHIMGGLTTERAKQIATILNTGAMPATLAPVQEQSP